MTTARTASRFGLAALLLLGAAAGPAAAHAVLVAVEPEDGVRLEASPGAFRLRFNEPVTPVAVELRDGAGRAVRDAAVEPQGRDLIVRPRAALPPSLYALSYRVTSADGHPVGATLRFAVGVDPPAAGDAEPAPLTSVDWAGMAARFLADLTLLGAAGLAAFLVLVRPPQPAAGRLRRFLPTLALAGLVALLLRLGVGGADLAGASPASLLTARPWRAVAGTSLVAAGGVAAIGLAVLAVAARRDSPRLLGAGAMLVAASFALTGHAATAAPRGLMAPALAVHVACAALWAASFLPLRAVLRGPFPAAHATLRRYSAVATVAVALLLASGAALAWVQLGGRPAALGDTAYGNRLLLKLALVAALLALAAVNRWRLTPGVGRGDARSRLLLDRTLLTDAGLVVAVLAVTASLQLGPPPRTETDDADAGMAAPAEQGLSLLAARDRRQAILTLLPGTAGRNRLEASVTDAAGAPVTAAKAVLRWNASPATAQPRSTAAIPARPGVYVASGLDLPRPGRWHLQLDLRLDPSTWLTFDGDLDVPAPSSNPEAP